MVRVEVEPYTSKAAFEQLAQKHMQIYMTLQWGQDMSEVGGLTWRRCQSHHPIEGERPRFKLHPFFSCLHLHFPL